MIALPKTTCLPSSQGVLAVVMKNWLPLVLGPELAIESNLCALVNSSYGENRKASADPGVECASSKFSSLNFSP